MRQTGPDMDAKIKDVAALLDVVFYKETSQRQLEILSSEIFDCALKLRTVAGDTEYLVAFKDLVVRKLASTQVRRPW